MLTIFDMRGNIQQDQTIDEKYKNITQEISIEDITKKQEKTAITNFLFCLKIRQKNILKYFSKKY